MREFLTIDELSEYLNIKKSTLYTMVENNEIPHYRIGRLLRFRADDVETWMESHRKEAVDTNKKARTALKAITKPRMDIDSLLKKTIDEVRGNRYTSSHRETRPIKDLRKEVFDGTL